MVSYRPLVLIALIVSLQHHHVASQCKKNKRYTIIIIDVLLASVVKSEGLFNNPLYHEVRLNVNLIYLSPHFSK